MGWFVNIKGRISEASLFASVLLLLYFGFHTFYGERGLRQYLHLSKEVEYARGLSRQYSRDKADWEYKVKLLSPTSLDLDMLDERVREVLNYVDSDEFVILDESSL